MKNVLKAILIVSAILIFSACTPKTQEVTSTLPTIIVFEESTAAIENTIASFPEATETKTVVEENSTPSEKIDDKIENSVPVKTDDIVENTPPEAERIPAGDIEINDAFTAYKRLNFFYGDFMDCYIEVYTQAEVDENGEVWWDDSNAFSAVAVIGESEFLLLPEEFIQLGEPKFSVFESEDGVLHITMEDRRIAQYVIYDFAYNSDENCFEKSVLVEFMGCNFWGTI